MATKKDVAGSQRQNLEVPGILLAEHPHVYLAAIPGRWLLAHSTPSWRIKDPQKGFQRIVKVQRAKEIARTVIDTHRAFPNAITLATDRELFRLSGKALDLPRTTRFLVVDGQHRLWAQEYSEVEAKYPCVIHMHRTEQQMASLFLEINDNQRRVPSSLRWDLVRLVRTEDQSTQMTADIVFELATRRESPFYSVGIDLTGEDKNTTIKQGSLAPEIRTLVSRNLKKHDGTFDDYFELLVRFFVAIRSIDPDGWGNPQSPFFRARVLRALLRVLSDLLYRQSFARLSTEKLRGYLERIKPETLSNEELRRVQGSAGVQDLYETISQQLAAE
jgi:DGQHR domain-containing protein